MNKSQPGSSDIRSLVEDILAGATLAEKIGMMAGKGFFKAFVEDGKIRGALH